MGVKEKRKIKRFRKKLIKKGFFEDVILDKASVVLNDPDGGISSWMFYLKKYKMAVLNRHFDYFNFSLIRINTAAVCALVEFACGAKVPSVLPDIISCSDSQSTAFLA